jgi:hypothetical protein
MKQILCFCAAACLVLWAGNVHAQIQEATHKVELSDAADDVQARGNNPGKDVVKVILDTDGKNLNVTVVLAEEAEFYLKGHQAGDVIEVLLDVDSKESTGGKPVFYPKSGFEFQIEVGACIEYENGGMACSGGLQNTKEINYFSTYALQKFTGGSDMELISEPFNWKDRGKDIQGNRIEVSIPYAAMQLAPGQSVRIAVKENDDATFKEEYLPEVLLTLK